MLLVPGWSNRARHMRPLVRHLLDRGWSEGSVHTVDFADPFGSNRRHAREIARAIDVLRDRTGVARIDVVAHSMGGLATRCYEAERDDPVCCFRRVVFLATPHGGTWVAFLAFGGGRREMLPGSELLRALAEREWPEDVETWAVRTPWDLRVLPHRNACFAHAREVVVERVTHQGLLRSPRAHRVIREILESPASA